MSAVKGDWGLSRADILRTRREGILQIRTPAFFRNLWCARTDMEGGEFEPVRSFCGQGEKGKFFAILCGRLLWTDPYEFTLLFWTTKAKPFITLLCKTRGLEFKPWTGLSHHRYFNSLLVLRIFFESRMQCCCEAPRLNHQLVRTCFHVVPRNRVCTERDRSSLINLTYIECEYWINEKGTFALCKWALEKSEHCFDLNQFFVIKW